MKAEEVDKALRQKFDDDDQRLVFWHDADGEFAEYVAAGLPDDLSDVHVLDVAEVGGLPAKLLLERDDPTGKYLVYSRGQQPPAQQDWLLDIRLYSAQFRADVASVWLNELGLSELYLRDHLKARAAFLGSQERRKKLRRLIDPGDNEAAIDLKMMAVLVGSQVADPFVVLRSLWHGHLQSGQFALDTAPEVLTTFAKMDLEESFWNLMKREFGYEADPPTLAGLLRQLIVSELLHQMDDTRIDPLAHFELPPAGRRNATVFLTQWRDSSEMATSYDAAANAVGAELEIGPHLRDTPLHLLRNVYTFLEAEKLVISGLKNKVLEEAQAVDLDFVASLAADRQAGHWLAGPGGDTEERRAIRDAYDAVTAAAEFFALHGTHREALSFDSPAALLEAYRDELYMFDRLYRRFRINAQGAIGQGWDLLKTIATEIERVYDQGVLQPLGREWSRLLDAGFLDTWALESFRPQQRFYTDQIRSHLHQSDRKRAFVIISDAFRYEAAAELLEDLNGRDGLSADLSAMLGVLPSYTRLGMASLLPHETLGYGDKGEVLVDGNSSAGLEARNRQLESVNGMACKAEALRVMTVDEARSFTADKRVVYIYHNVIDAQGDHAPSEGTTFDAVSACISEIVELVHFCVSKLNASKVWVTADHGFLFQHESPSATDRTALSFTPPQAIVKNKRYVLGRNLGSAPEAHVGSTTVTAGTEDAMDFWVPRGANRFNFVGGARFFHGGAMPQEVVVPVVTVTRLRGKEKDRARVEKVSLQVLGTRHKITAPVYRFELIQTEPVSDRRKPITVRAAVLEGELAVTTIETVVFDSTAKSLDERKKAIRLELRSGTFDKTIPYRLVLRDIETDAEVLSVPVVIDRSFDDDF